MKVLALIALLACTAVLAQDFAEEDDVLVLTTANFPQALEKFPHLLVEFYAPWCGHCKKLTPEYSKAAKELKDKGVTLAKVDATVEEELGNLYEVKGFPTLKFFSISLTESPTSYEGPRQASDIVNYILKKISPPTTEFQNIAELQTATENVAEQPVAVFFGTSVDDQAYLDYTIVAKQFERITFYHTFAPEAREQFSFDADVKVVLFKSFDEKRNIYSENVEVVALSHFLTVNSVPTVMPFNDKAIQAIFQAGHPALFLFANENEESTLAFEEFSQVASQFKDKVKFAFSKPNDGFGFFSRLAEYVGADENVLPNLMLVDPARENAKFKYTKEITRENIQAFVTDFVNGNLVRYLKSDPLPETNSEPVKIIVGLNFDDLVKNNEQDVLVEFYAPWCGHCKQLAPIYDELATKLAGNPNIVIAKCDATGNEIPGVDIQSFPTIKFWKNGSKGEPLAFQGDRDLKGFLAFLKENTSHPWVDIESHDDL